jgi:hypothetical protein
MAATLIPLGILLLYCFMNPILHKNQALNIPMRQVISGSVSATQLYKEYNSNEILADKKYKNKIIRLYGMVYSVGADILGSPYIALEVKDQTFGQVQCMFPFSRKDELLSISKGEDVVIEGVCSGKVLTVVLLKNCVLQK